MDTREEFRRGGGRSMRRPPAEEEISIYDGAEPREGLARRRPQPQLRALHTGSRRQRTRSRGGDDDDGLGGVVPLRRRGGRGRVMRRPGVHSREDSPRSGSDSDDDHSAIVESALLEQQGQSTSSSSNDSDHEPSNLGSRSPAVDPSASSPPPAPSPSAAAASRLKKWIPSLDTTSTHGSAPLQLTSLLLTLYLYFESIFVFVSLLTKSLLLLLPAWRLYTDLLVSVSVVLLNRVQYSLSSWGNLRNEWWEIGAGGLVVLVIIIPIQVYWLFGLNYCFDWEFVIHGLGMGLGLCSVVMQCIQLLFVCGKHQKGKLG